MDKKKNNPTGFRYDKEKMSFVQESENLKSPQMVLHFLLDKYWWEKKIGNNPVTERNYENRLDIGNLNPQLDKKTTKYFERNKNVTKPLTQERIDDYKANILSKNVKLFTPTSKNKLPNLLADIGQPKHPLWKEGDPKEGSNAFFIRYGAFTYDEISKKQD